MFRDNPLELLHTLNGALMYVSFVPAALMWSLGRYGNAKLVAGDWFAVPSF
jgi:hypothetical protein